MVLDGVSIYIYLAAVGAGPGATRTGCIEATAAALHVATPFALEQLLKRNAGMRRADGGQHGTATAIWREYREYT